MVITLAPWQIQAIVKARQIPESHRGSSVRTSQSVQEASQSPHGASQTADLPPPIPSLIPKNSQPFTLSLKIKNSGVLTAPLQLFNSGSVDVTMDAATTSNKVNLKNLELLCGNCEGDGQPLRSLKHGGNKGLIVKNVFPSSVPVCSSWAYTKHKLIYAHHAYFTPPTPV